MKLSFLIILILTGNWALPARAQPPLPPASRESAAITGSVEEYGSNPDDDIDKIRIKTGGETMWFHFPPHTAAAILDIAKLHSIVTIVSRPAPGPGGRNVELSVIFDEAQKRSVSVQSIPPPPPEAGKNVSCRGNITECRTDADGSITAVVVDSCLILLPPHVRNSLTPLLKANIIIEVHGVQRSAGIGFVNIQGMGIIRPDTLKIGKINYLVR